MPPCLQALPSGKPKARTVPAALKSLKDLLPVLEKLLELAAVLRQRRSGNGSIISIFPCLTSNTR